MNDMASKLAKGSLWLGMTRAAVNGLAALSTFFLARLLAPSDFGLIAIGTTLLAIVSSLTELSLTQALVLHKNPDTTHLSTAWTLNILRGLLLGILFSICAQPVSAIYEDPRLAGVMHALGASVVLGGLTNPRLVMLQRRLVFHQEFLLGISQKFLGLAASLVVALAFRSYWALIVGILASQLTNIVVSYWILPFKPRPTVRHARELLSFSIWLSAGQVVNTLNWRFDQLLIGKSLGSETLGHYTVGSNLAMLATREAISPIKQTVFPSFAAIKHNPERLRLAYQRVQSLLSAIALPIGIGVAVTADRIVPLALGSQWLPVAPVIQILASVFALQTLGSLVQPLGMANGETRLLFMRDLQMLCVRVPVIIFSMMFYGLAGVLFARVFTGLLAAGINMLIVRRFIQLPVLAQLRANTRALISVILMAMFVSLTSSWLPAAQSTAASLVQLVGIVLLAALSYTLSTFLLWRFKGYPEGPEMEIMNLVGKLRSRLAR